MSRRPHRTSASFDEWQQHRFAVASLELLSRWRMLELHSWAPLLLVTGLLTVLLSYSDGHDPTGLYPLVVHRSSAVALDSMPRTARFCAVLVSGAIFKLMILFAPIVFWFTGTAVIRATVPELLYWMGPAIAASLLFTLALSEKLVLPVIADVTQFLTMFSVSRTVIQAAVSRSKSRRKVFRQRGTLCGGTFCGNSPVSPVLRYWEW
jgi:hypothetical protein